jgi:parvulin-like peptidyl-prolyl isomerase
MSTTNCKCSTCEKEDHQTVFSKRQRKRAEMGEPARCASCIAKDNATKAAESPTKKPVVQRANQRVEKNMEQLDEVVGSLGGDSASSDNVEQETDNNRKAAAQRARKRQIRAFFDDEAASDGMSEEDFDDDSDSEQEVSLLALKQKILGRDVTTDENDTENDQPFNKYSDKQNDLQTDLTCPVCHGCFYNPVSLQCGHSFCQECVFWWLGRGSAGTSDGNCPTCRQICNNEVEFGVNVALRAVVEAIFPEETRARRQAHEKLVRGESGGAHARGYQVVVAMDEEVWHGYGALGVRRSVVLDAQDQCMQLALAFKDEPTFVNNMLCVHLCLLHLEEDEAGYGIPFVIKEQGDEHLITYEQRFASYVDVTANDDPVARRPMGVDESALFQIDLNALNGVLQLLFVHKETGASLEIRLPKDKKRAKAAADALVRRREAQLQKEEDEEDEANEYDDDDGFLVGDGVEDESDEDDGESDLCCICNECGDLLICDGGDHLEGCGRLFHVACVGRVSVPAGDWVCQACANAFEIASGREGHEFGVVKSDNRKRKLAYGDSKLERSDDDSAFDKAEPDINENDGGTSDKIDGAFSSASGEDSNAGSEHSVDESPIKPSRAKRTKTRAIIDSDSE